MKLYLASYFQQENHGQGKKYGVSPDKPGNIDNVELCYPDFSPNKSDMIKYYVDRKIDMEKAGKVFEKTYKEKLNNFALELEKAAKEENKSVIELLPFEEGDTLLSWEKAENISYRPILAEYLVRFGYEVELQ